MSLEDINYYGDRRVRAGESQWWGSIDERKMEATVLVYDNKTDESFIQAVPVTFDVCPTCEGKGKHVNPSIDCGGITGEDFDRDPDFREEYLNGVYDVPCYGCRGKRVVPVCADPEVSEYLKKKAEDDEDFRRVQDAERRMGC